MGWARAVSQRRLTIYWQANERLGRNRATSGVTRFEMWWMRANRAPTAMCHRQRLLALAMFEPARPCSTFAGTKLEDTDAGKRRRWSCSTNPKPKAALVGRQSSMPLFKTDCRASRAAGRRSNRDFEFQSCAAGVAGSSTAQAGCVIAHTNTEPAKAIERRPCSGALNETS